MKVLVLGHTGFVGSNVVDILKNNNIDYKGVSKSEGTDLRVEDELIHTLSSYKPDFIVNCAAQVGSLNYVTEFAGDVISNNSKLIITLYEAVRKVDAGIKIINPVANCGYPGNADIYQEINWLDGAVHKSVLSYGNTRRLLVAFSDCYRMQYNIKSINYLVPNMYGEHDSTDSNKAHALNALISKFVKADYENNSSINIWGTGKVIREWLYAKDFAKIVLLTLKTPKLHKVDYPVNIAQNSGLSIKDLVYIINKKFNNSFKLIYDTTKPDGAPKKVMDNKLFRKLFPQFNFISFDKGIENTILYYKEKYPY